MSVIVPLVNPKTGAKTTVTLPDPVINNSTPSLSSGATYTVQK